MSDIKSQNVFVYGTLKRGHRNHEKFMPQEIAKFVEKTTTKEACFLMRCFESASSPGNFTPGVFLGGTGKIIGELYRVTQEGLAALDELEDLGRKYHRHFIPLANGEQGWMYVEIPGNRFPILGNRNVICENNLYEWTL